LLLVDGRMEVPSVAGSRPAHDSPVADAAQSRSAQHAPQLPSGNLQQPHIAHLLARLGQSVVHYDCVYLNVFLSGRLPMQTGSRLSLSLAALN
jgi:hypothetical protein